MFSSGCPHFTASLGGKLEGFRHGLANPIPLFAPSVAADLVTTSKFNAVKKGIAKKVTASLVAK
jgi:hypothetical protein